MTFASRHYSRYLVRSWLSRAVALAIVVPSSQALRAQAATPPIRPSSPVGDTSIFAPLVLPTANDQRSGSGAPGARYWQNRADYALAATLDTTTKTLRGEMTLRYSNRSPDTLRYIWLQVEQNAFKDRSLNSYIFPQDSRFGARGFEGGYTFSKLDQILSTPSGSSTKRVP